MINLVMQRTDTKEIIKSDLRHQYCNDASIVVRGTTTVQTILQPKY